MSSHFRRSCVALCSLGVAALLAPHAKAQPASDVSIANLQTDVRELTRNASRMPGTPGYNKAANYVLRRFREIGLQQVHTQRYNVTAPVTQFARLSLNGRTLELLPIYPNHVVPSSTPPEGISGSLVYAGLGRPADYNGQKIEGAIVVLDFDSGMNWFTAADLGARAIIFLAPPNGSSRGQAEQKFASLPLEVPRYYAQGETANAIFGVNNGFVPASSATAALRPGARNLGQATVTSQVLWNTVPAQNIIGEIPGTDAGLTGKPGGVVVIGGYFDSMSITPDLAPGAEAAGNMAALLEVARYFKAHPQRYTLQFVAEGAHHLALAGMRNWVAQNLANLDPSGDAKQDQKVKDAIATYKAFIGLDLTSRTRTVGLFAKSAFYNQMFKDNNSENILLNYYADFAKGVEFLANKEAVKRRVARETFYVDGVRGQEGRTWRSYLPAPTALDSEAATLAAKPGISLATANDLRLYQDTPFDTPERMNFENLAAQIGTINTLLTGVMTPGAGDIKADTMTRLPDEKNFSTVFGYVAGRAIRRTPYGEKGSGASFLPDTPIPDEALVEDENKTFAAIKKPTPADKSGHAAALEQLVGTRAVAYVLDKSASPARQDDFKSYCGVRGAFIERVRYSREGAPQRVGGQKQKRVAQFVFLGPRVGDPKGGGTPQYEIETYTVNGAGRVTFAPDMGSARANFSPMYSTVKAAYDYRDKALGALNVDASNICFPCRATALFDSVDQRYFSVLREMNVLDASTDANPIEIGFIAPSAPNGVADIEPAAIVFAIPGARFKLIMAQGLLGKRLVLLNATPSDPKATETTKYEGAGFVVPSDPNALSLVRVPYQTARDLWTLDHQRISLLKKFGITNSRVEVLHGSSGCRNGLKPDTYACPTEAIAAPNGGAIGAATASLANYQYDKFYLHARRAFGLESRAYPDVEATAQDVLKGIIFYLALLLPFSYFMERLLFGFPDIRKQIMGTSMCFLIVFICIRYVHPAFELALTPFIILLAFIIFALTVVVTSFLTSKFEAEIKRLKQGVHFADVGRLSALGAALGLGIANMRRRPTRTALTCTTLILLTFTVLSFTSVTANISNFARPYGDGTTPSRQGVMVRQPNWSAMPQAAVNSLRNEFGQTFGGVAPRSWLLARDQSETLYVRVANAQNPEKYFNATALCGFTPEEATIDSPAPKTVLPGYGRWFQAGDGPYVCLLPKSQFEAQKNANAATPSATPNAATPSQSSTQNADTGPPLGLTLDQWQNAKVLIGGQDFTCIGVYDDAQWTGRLTDNSGSASNANTGGNIRAIRDLDDEKLTPVDYASAASQQANTAANTASQQSGSTQVQRYEHMDATALPLLPYDTVLAMGGNTRSLAASFRDAKSGPKELNNLMNRAAVGIFGAAPDPANGGKVESKLYSSVESTSYEGFSALLVPILIAALIIANTMLGSVFERTREIGIYSSIGLAPIHVAALFIAEAMVYAVLGSISGYLIAQLVAKVVTTYRLLEGLTLNYSSSSAVIATLIVMATVLLSTLYPAIQAGRLSQPDRGRTDLGEPIGDVWRLQFPFTVSGLQSLGMAQFLSDFFETHTDTSVGVFYTDKIHFSSLPLHEAVAVLNKGFEGQASSYANGSASPTDHANGNGHAAVDGQAKEVAREIKSQESLALSTGAIAMVPEGPNATTEPTPPTVNLEAIAADPNTEVYRLSMRVWLAPFDMGVSQDTDIFLLPSPEPGLNELQLRLERRSGEIAAWKRVNRGFLGDLRKQLLLWRTLKPAQQGEYILRGRAHTQGQIVPVEEPGLAVQ